MASKNSSTSPTNNTKATTPPAGGRGLATQASDGGLANLTSQPSKEAGKKVEILQKAQLDSSPKEKPKESPPVKRTLPSPASRPRRYALEIWVTVEVSPGEYAPPGEDTYSADFIKDTLNFAYPGCTGVYLAEASHLVAFYGKKNATGVGLSVEQGMEACQIVGEIAVWMGRIASLKIQAVSLQEATDIVNSLKRLERENFRRACRELDSRLSALKLGQAPSGLSASATPFVPLAASLAVALGQPVGVGLPPTQADLEPTRSLYTTDDEGTTTDSTLSSVSTKASSRKCGSHGSKKKRKPGKGSESDSGASTVTASHGAKKNKKGGINAKVSIPEFGGKAAHPHDVVDKFRSWARTVACHREYYEDEYLMSQVIASLKDDAARMFNFARRNNPGWCWRNSATITVALLRSVSNAIWWKT